MVGIVGIGVIYEVPSETGGRFSDQGSKADWYRVMDNLHLETAPQLNCGDTIKEWVSELAAADDPIVKFFFGDTHAADNDFGDPNISFVGSNSVKSSLQRLEHAGQQYFIEMFPLAAPGKSGEAWLYEPLVEFLREIASKNAAALVLWEP